MTGKSSNSRNREPTGGGGNTGPRVLILPGASLKFVEAAKAQAGQPLIGDKAFVAPLLPLRVGL
jgi:hypothetical protein